MIWEIDLSLEKLPFDLKDKNCGKICGKHYDVQRRFKTQYQERRSETEEIVQNKKKQVPGRKKTLTEEMEVIF